MSNVADKFGYQIGIVVIDARNELYFAVDKFAPFNSAHEGFAVLKEEVDELWDEVKAKQGACDVAKMRKEAVQVAAMAMRFVLDVCDSERGQK
jgi:hypothetical protein